MSCLSAPIFRLLRLGPFRACFRLLSAVVEWPMRGYFGIKAIVLEGDTRPGAPTGFDALAESAEEAALVRSAERLLADASAGAKQRFFLWAENQAIEDEHGLAYAERTFEWMRREIVKAKGGLEGLRILELGPGQTLTTGLLLYASGARSYTAVDLFFMPGRNAHVYRQLRKHLAERPLLVPVDAEAARQRALARFDEAVKLEGEQPVFDASKVEYRWPVDAASLPFPDGGFDVVVSLASFEHFQDPFTAAGECARVLAPSGVGLHQVDLRDHRDFAKPLDFLRYSDAEWRTVVETSKTVFTNRLRKSDFVRAFSGGVLSLERVEVNEKASLSPDLRTQLDPAFRARPDEDLEALGIFLVMRKP